MRKDCAEFLALKKKNGDKPPPGYKGAREIAYQKWKDNQKKLRDDKKDGRDSNSVRALCQDMPDLVGDQANEPDSEITEADVPNGRFEICARLQQPQWEPVKNGTPIDKAIVRRFDPQTHKPISCWNNFIKVPSKKEFQKMARMNTITVTSERDLD